MATVRAFSYGGGVQSTAALVLAAQGEIDFPLFLFANVGDDSENPATLEYVESFAKPFAAERGIELAEVRRVRRNGETETLMQRIDRDLRSVPIPMRSGAGAAGNRSCTGDFKIAVIAKELKRRGATKHTPAITGLGISREEFHRMRSDSGIPHQVLTYPLIDLGMDRQDCMNVITRAGMPVPPKSSCYFCPFHRIGEWKRMKREQPDLYKKSVELERRLSQRSVAIGRVPVFLTYKGRPLDEVVGDHDQLELFDGGCDIAGYCHI